MTKEHKELVEELEEVNTRLSKQYNISGISTLRDAVHAITELSAKVEELGHYAIATQYWKLEPHDQKERNAFWGKLLLPVLMASTQQPNKSE